jgi:hypothetical protein
MRIGIVIAAPDGRGTARANAGRLVAASEALRRAAAERAQLVVLPAGFLRAEGEDGVRAIAAPVLSVARGLGVAVVVGVDTRPLGSPPAASAVACGALPYFLVAAAPGRAAVVWRQRSTSGADAHDAPPPHARRTLRVGDTDVDVFACGEIYSPPLRAAAEAGKPRVVIVASHAATGARFFQAERWAERAGARALLRATHARSPATSTGSPTSLLAELPGAWLLYRES